MTAAHCTFGKKLTTLRIRAGSSLSNLGGTMKFILRVHQHDLYKKVSHPHDYDFVIMELFSDLIWSDKIEPISLPKQDEAVPDKTICAVMGWGVTQNIAETRNILRVVTLRTISQSQ